MAEHLTRRELKTDQFAITAEHAFDFLGMHRRQAIQAGGLVLLALVLIGGGYLWWDHARGVRADRLSEALQIADAPVGSAAQPGATSFPNQQAKDAAETKALTGITRDFSGSREAAMADYMLAGLASTAGHDDEARRHFQAAADSGNKEYASLAKLALAEMAFSQNREADGRKLLQELIDRPTAVVSKAQATITLARLLSHSHPKEARALLTPLTKEPGQVGQMASLVEGDIPGK